MEKVTLGWLAKAAGGRLVGGNPRQPVTGLCLDSRRVAAGDCFVALPGEHTDGHAFIARAFAAGAVGALCSRLAANVPCVRVPNPRLALGQIAAAYRRRFKALKVVGITGSSGKTTTKEMLSEVLKTRYRVLANAGNLNNDLGVPLTLARLDGATTAAVVEMGMNHAGEIRALARLAAPQVGVITNIGDAHVGHFRDRRALALAKAELLAELPRSGWAIINLDDPNLATRASRRRITFGTAEKADVRIHATGVHIKGTRVILEHGGQTAPVWLRALGAHQAWNAAAAVAAGLALGVPFKTACRALEQHRPEAAMRSQLLKIGPHRVIHDAYNSNPQSAAAAVRLLAELPTRGKKIFVAGSMLELGEISPEAHRRLGQEAVLCGVDAVLAVGREARPLLSGARACPRRAQVATAAGVMKILGPWLSREGDLILLKGSRGVGLERVVEDLKKRFRV
jgi:UDP-N-acetylmuramoyl-tripeptide--D-alanyl-D-alanine ligase